MANREKRACQDCRANLELKDLLDQVVSPERKAIVAWQVWTACLGPEETRERRDHLDRLDHQVLLDHPVVTEAKVNLVFKEKLDVLVFLDSPDSKAILELKVALVPKVYPVSLDNQV